MSITVSDIPSHQPMLYADGYKAGKMVGAHEKQLAEGKIEDQPIQQLEWVQAFNHGKRVASGHEEPPKWDEI